MATAAPVVDFALIVDQLGDIKAKIATLKQAEARLTEALAQNGPGAYEGITFRATVSSTAASYSLDAKAAEEKLRELGVDGRWFSRHQKERKASTAVRVVARKGV